MNQIIKDVIYSKGTQRQIEFMANAGGMNDEEREVFQMIHEGKTDLYIQEEMSLSRKSLDRVVESIRAKLTIAIFHCIDYTMDKEA